MHSKFLRIFVSTRGSRLVNWLVIEAKREASASLFVILDHIFFALSAITSFYLVGKFFHDHPAFHFHGGRHFTSINSP